MNTNDPIKSKRVPRFVEEYAKDRNGTQAAIRAGYSRNVDTAAVTAHRLLSDAKVQELVRVEIERVSKDANVAAADVLRNWFEIATADPSKLTHVRRLNCRHCHGVGFGYQWSAREFAEACDRAAANPHPKTGEVKMPDCGGGFGWRRVAEPNPDCPECDGEGVEDVFIADLESLSGAERKLFAGVKQTRNGVEVMVRDQSEAVRNIAKYLGMLVDKKELTGANGQPLIPEAIPLNLPTDVAALAALYGSLMSGKPSA